jgi:phosphatidylglycerophosphatase A
MSSPDAAAPRRGGLLDAAAFAVATGLGSGYSPFAPGTAGSAVGLALFWPMRGLGPAWQAMAIVAVSALGVAAASWVARRAGQEDPGLVVVDEVAGMWVTLAFLPVTPLLAALGFVAFRVMDVFKPWPARNLEDLPGGWGIMADDLMAGVYANLLLRVLLLSGLVA